MRAIDIKHAEIGTVTSRVDGAVRFAVVTPELTLEQRSTVLGLHGRNVRVMVEPIDVPVEGLDEVESEAEPKSKCQRLRAVLFVWWKQKYGNDDGVSFTDFYNSKMERIIDRCKEALD